MAKPISRTKLRLNCFTVACVFLTALAFSTYLQYSKRHHRPLHHNLTNATEQQIPAATNTPIPTRVVKAPSFFDANSDDTRALIDRGADVNQRDADGGTALFYADSLKAVTLLNAHAMIDARNKVGQTPLIYNCAQGNCDAVLVLLARRPNVSARDMHGTTALLAAAAHCRLEILKALIHAGADVRAVKNDGTTALMYSLYNSDERVFDWLLSRSPDLNAHGMGDNTALSIARQLHEQAITTGTSPARYGKAIKELLEREAE